MEELDEETRTLAPALEATTVRVTPLVTGATSSTTGSKARVQAGAEDALRRDEIGRIGGTARLMVALSVFGIGLIPLVDVDRTAKLVLASVIITNALAYGAILYLASHPARYAPARIGLLAQLACVGIWGLDYVFGPYSAAPMATVLPLFAYAMGQSRRWAFAAYVHNASAHLLMGVMLGSGWIVDRAVLRSDLSVHNQLVAESCIQTVTLFAFLLGRWSRAKTVATIGELEQAVRQIAERDALLAELHHHLDEAAGLGAPGRFTDHVIGSYRLGPLIGRGGMGEVYTAAHTETGAAAAVKMLKRGMLAEPGKVARFLRELEIARRIDAPNVVTMLEVGDPTADLPYLAMELLEGDDLSELLRRRRVLPPAEVVTLVGEVAAGLDAAHAAGIIHRDLKPSNLFLHQARIWKILDFGVSKLGDGADLTRNVVLGTPAYMAPEQVRGETIDARADVYALAAIAYRALTGAALFGAPDVTTTLYLVAHRMPARPGSIASLPADVDLVLALGLSKRADDRFASATELAVALAEAVRSALSEPLRARARAVLAERPWGELRESRPKRR